MDKLLKEVIEEIVKEELIKMNEVGPAAAAVAGAVASKLLDDDENNDATETAPTGPRKKV